MSSESVRIQGAGGSGLAPAGEGDLIARVVIRRELKCDQARRNLRLSRAAYEEMKVAQPTVRVMRAVGSTIT